MKGKTLKVLFSQYVAVLLFVALAFACNQKPKKKPDALVKPPAPVLKEGEIDLTVKKDSQFVPLNTVLPESGIPYTATHKEVNSNKEIEIKASANDGMAFRAEVINPEKDAPLTITGGGGGIFGVAFKKVEKATPVTVRFSYYQKNNSQNIIYKDVKITILPEPSVEKIETDDLNLIIGLDYDLTKSPFTYEAIPLRFTCSPAKIGEIDASAYVLKASKVVTYGKSSNESVATITEGKKVHTIKSGEANIEILCNGVKKGDVKIVVGNKCVPKRISSIPRSRNINLLVGETQDVKIIGLPQNADLELKGDWTCSDKTVAKIEKKDGEEGVYTITALKKGEVDFKIFSKYSSLLLSIEVKVVDEKVKLNHNFAELIFDEVLQLTAKILPESAPQKVDWGGYVNSITPLGDILNLDNKTGKITALKKRGSAKITAFSSKNRENSAKCIVTIAKSKIESVTANKSEITIAPDGTAEVEVEIQPADAADELAYDYDASLSVWGDGLIEKKPGTENTHICKLKAGSIEDDTRVVIFCPSNPKKKVEIIVHVKKS